MALIKQCFNQSYLKSFLLLIITVATGCLLYKILEFQTLKHSAALFLGIPVLMSVILATYCNQKYITLNVMLGLSLGLIASFLYLNEGSFCVPMTAPLFLASGLIVSASFIKLRKTNYTQSIYFLPVIFLALLSVEGLNNNTSFDRSVITNTFKDVSLTSEQIQHALSQNKTFSKLPLLLSYGFPQPKIVTNQGSNLGDERSIYFSGGEGEPGIAVFKISHRSHNSIEYTLINDTSHISHWLNWKTSKVSWTEVSPGVNRVTWSIEYERMLDPAWYFSPIQKYAVQLSAEVLIDNLVL